MKKKDCVLRRYLCTLTVILCAFGLVLGIAEARGNSAALARGVSEPKLTQKQVQLFLQQHRRTAAEAIRRTGYFA